MVVMKFGGTSVLHATRMIEVYNIVVDYAKTKQVVVVLSAMKGTTEHLILAAQRAIEYRKEDEQSFLDIYTQIYDRHIVAWKELMAHIGFSVDEKPVPKKIIRLLKELEEILQGIHLIKEFTLRTQDLILSFGERLSCTLFSEFINIRDEAHSAVYIDARKCIKTNANYGAAGVLFDKTYKLLQKVINQKVSKQGGDKKRCIPVVTGFIASTEEGITTTIGRNGSDYTAAIVGAAIQARQVEIWTDVDGVLSADPRMVSDAFLVPSINYSEAMELSYFGAKVLHPQTVVPAIEKNIPITIKNTMNPSASGTVISSTNKESRFPIAGLASVQDVGILTIEGVGISGNFYFLPDVFQVFASHHIQPLMITQSSSEHSISFVLNKDDVESMKQNLKNQFADELKQKKIQDIEIKNNNTIISVIGSHMQGTRGLAGRIFGTMGREGINVIAIAQGSNEINVSFVIEKKNERLAIQSLHNEFFGDYIKKGK